LDHLEAVRALQPRGPYVLGGWSFGGLVAFEMASKLRELGQEVAFLALLDTVPPDGDIPSGEDEDDAEIISWYAEDFVHFFGRNLTDGGRPALLSADDLRVQGDEERLRYLHRIAGAVHGLTEDSDLERVRRLLAVYRINQSAARRYRPRAAFPGRVHLFRAEQVREDGAPEMALGWAPWIGGSLETHPVPGTHDTFL